MPDSAERPGPRRQDAVRRLARPAVALIGVILFQLLFASAFVGVLHHPVPHQAPVAVAGRSPLAQMVSGHGAGTVRLVDEPTAAAARAALSGGQVNAAIIAGPMGESLLIQTAASPGTAGIKAGCLVLGTRRQRRRQARRTPRRAGTRAGRAQSGQARRSRAHPARQIGRPHRRRRTRLR